MKKKVFKEHPNSFIQLQQNLRHFTEKLFQIFPFSGRTQN